MKKLTVAVTVVTAALLTGCDSNTSSITHRYVLPPELSKCKIYDMSNGTNSIKVVHCPNSTTTTSYRSGKTHKNVTIID